MTDPISPDVLLIEDDLALADLVSRYLTGQGFSTHAVHRGDDGLAMIRQLQPRLVILDLMLPGLDGLEVCRQARLFFRGPILMLTARDEDIDQILGLEMGADDYLIKPVEPRLLLAHIRALLRRVMVTPEPEADLQVGAIVVKPAQRRAYVSGQEADLTTAEYDLLRYLLERAGQVVSRDDLCRDLRGIEYDGLDRWVDLRVSRLRSVLRALDPKADAIRTVRGQGYLLRGERP